MFLRLRDVILCLAWVTVSSWAVSPLPLFSEEMRALEPGPAKVAKKLHRRLEALDREVEERWRQIRVGRLGELGPGSPLARETERLRTQHDLLLVRSQSLAGKERRIFRSKLRAVARRIENLELVAGGVAPPALEPRGRAAEASRRGFEGASTSVSVSGSTPGWTSAATLSPFPAAVTAANSCASAPSIGVGAIVIGTTVGATNDGTASCGASDFSPDVWLKFTSPASASYSIDTFGSSFDTVLSVHSACPGSGFELACNDDTLGLRSAVTVGVVAGNTVWIRVSGFDGAAGPFELQLGQGGSVEGTVTHTGSGTPVATGEVDVLSSSGFHVLSAPLAADGSYTAGPLQTGAGYRVRTRNLEGARDEVWDDHPCTSPEICDAPGADAVPVASVTTTPDIDFSLEQGGEIAGTVRHGLTGNPAEGVIVVAKPISASNTAVTALSGADGSYVLEGLDAGSVHVFTSSAEFQTQLYAGVDCPGLLASCDRSLGTAVPVTLGVTTSGIDFDLVRRGAIAGTVTASATGLPIEGATVSVLDDLRIPRGTTDTDAAGVYEVAGLVPGTYFLKVSAAGFAGELFDDLECHWSCNEATGTPIELTLDEVAAGIDFALQEVGTVAGTLTDAVSGDPVVTGGVDIFDTTERRIIGAVSGSSGTYGPIPLTPGQYFLVASGRFDSDFLDQLYDGLPCFEGCDPTTGTPVSIAAGAPTAGIDFALDRGGTLTGTVRNSVTGLPEPNIHVEIFSGIDVVRSLIANGLGVYTGTGLLPGSYFVRTDETRGWVNQIYDGVNCLEDPFGRCIEAGTPVEIQVNTITGGIDFLLDPRGLISGRVTDLAGVPFSFGSIEAYNAMGSFVKSDGIAGDGSYHIENLVPGTYFVRASAPDRVAEVYEDVLCDPTCDPTVGSPVAVGKGEDVQGIDFALGPRRSISGRVTQAATGEPVANAFLSIRTPSGSLVTSASAGSDGSYTSQPLAPGVYRVVALANGLLAELYDDFPCPGSCDVSKGDPVAVGTTTDTTGIDFALDVVSGGMSGTVLDASTGEPIPGVPVVVVDQSGVEALRTTSRETGVWLASLPTGTYFAFTEAPDLYVDQVYSGIECGEICMPLGGTPVSVQSSQPLVREVDFILRRVPEIFQDGFESGDLSVWVFP